MRAFPGGAALLFALAGVTLLATSPLFAPDTAPAAGMVKGLAFEFFLAMLALAGASLSDSGISERLGLRRSRIPWGTTLLLTAGTLALSYALNGIYDLSGLAHDGALTDFESDLIGIRGWMVAGAAFSFALVPGIAEEMLCRGLIQRGLHDRVGPLISVALAALIFGALHVEPVYALLAAVLGAYLGTVALLGASIRPAIFCHAVNNLVAVLTAAWAIEIELDGVAGGLSVAVAATAAGGSLLWAWRQLGGPPARENRVAGLQPDPGSDDA